MRSNGHHQCRNVVSACGKVYNNIVIILNNMAKINIIIMSMHESIYNDNIINILLCLLIFLIILFLYIIEIIKKNY